MNIIKRDKATLKTQLIKKQDPRVAEEIANYYNPRPEKKIVHLYGLIRLC